MSTYNKITRHPHTGKYQLATWHDDYFAPHVYGVSFPNDKVVYPTDMVLNKELKEFWAEDVIEAFRRYLEEDVLDVYERPMTETLVIDFLSRIDVVFKERWKEDPTSGHGAAEYYKRKFEI